MRRIDLEEVAKKIGKIKVVEDMGQPPMPILHRNPSDIPAKKYIDLEIEARSLGKLEIK
jgi:hypothetical protein